MIKNKLKMRRTQKESRTTVNSISMKGPNQIRSNIKRRQTKVQRMESISTNRIVWHVEAIRNIRELDLFGNGVLIFNNGKSSHKTFLGSFCTILTYPSLVLLFFYMVMLFDFSNQDVVFTSTDLYSQENPHSGLQMNETGDSLLNFKLYMEDYDYDNDDNPYGKMIMHMYSNMDNLTDIGEGGLVQDKGYYDIAIPLVLCNDVKNTPDW